MVSELLKHYADPNDYNQEKNVKLVTAALVGKGDSDALADFEFNENGASLLKCIAGHESASLPYTKTTRQCRVSFDRNHCADCPYQDQCHPKIKKTCHVYHLKKCI